MPASNRASQNLKRHLSPLTTVTSVLTTQPWPIHTCNMASQTGHISKWIQGYNSLRPRRNGRRFTDDTFKGIFLNKNVRISIKVSLKFVPKGPINNNAALVQIMAWRRSGNKPLSEPMMVSLLTHICVTRPQWVNILCYRQVPLNSIFHKTCTQFSVIVVLSYIIGSCLVFTHIFQDFFTGIGKQYDCSTATEVIPRMWIKSLCK